MNSLRIKIRKICSVNYPPVLRSTFNLTPHIWVVMAILMGVPLIMGSHNLKKFTVW